MVRQERIGRTSGEKEEKEKESGWVDLPADSEQVWCSILKRCN